MKLALHLLKKDLDRFKTILGVWAFLVLLPVLMGLLGLVISPKDVELHTTLLQVCFYDSWLQQLLAIVLVGLVIQEEPLVGSQAFWITRPVSPWMLIREKSLFIGSLLVAVPLVMGAVSLALQGMMAGDIQLALPEMLLRQLATVLLAALAAALTPNFGRFLPVALLTYTLLWFSNYWSWIVNLLGGNNEKITAQLNLTDCRWVVGALLAILLGALLTGHQYLTRRTKRTVLLALAAFGLVFVVEQAWKWDCLEPIEFGDNWINPEINAYGNDLKGIFTGLTIDSYEALPLPGRQPKNSVVMLGNLKMTGLWPQYEWRFMGTEVGHTYNDNFSFLILKDQKVQWLEGYQADRRFRWRKNPSPTAVESALGGPKVVNLGMGQSRFIPFLVLDPDSYKKYEDVATALKIPLRFQFVDYKKEAELPLEEGSGFQDGSESVSILEVSPQVHGVNVKIQDQVPYLLFKPDPKIAPSVRDLDDEVYVLVNRKLGQAFLAEPRSLFWKGDLSQIKQPWRVDRQVLKFVGKGGPRGVALDEAWLKDAVLVRLKVETRGIYKTVLNLDPFTLKGNSVNFRVPWAGGLVYSLGIPIREQ